MSAPIRLRNRVLLMTAGFAVSLLAITFGLSLQARRSQERWTRIVSIERDVVATIEELIRAHNAFRTQIDAVDPRAAERYQAVRQLLERPRLRDEESATLRQHVEEFNDLLQERAVPKELDAASLRLLGEARRLIDSRKQEIERELPRLERDTRSMMIVGLAIAWLIILLTGVAVKVAYQRVVKPIEELARAAAMIAREEPGAKLPVRGDLEVVELGRALDRMATKLSERARTDDLTGLPNFRAFRERIEDEIQRSNRFGYEFGILVLDLDRFKQYNDRFGHLAGNDALQAVAAVIREAVRKVDFPARYGGEEFAVVAPQIDTSTLTGVAERIRAMIESLPAPPGLVSITVSIGAAIYPADGATADALFAVADERLYRAKRDGRNRVVVSSPRAAQSAG